MTFREFCRMVGIVWLVLLSITLFMAGMYLLGIWFDKYGLVWVIFPVIFFTLPLYAIGMVAILNRIDW